MFSIKLLNQSVVLLTTYEVIQDAFTKHGSVMSDRPDIPLFSQVSNRNSIIEQNYNETFKMHRRNGNKIFKGLENTKVSMEKVTMEEAGYLMNYLKQYCGKPIDIKFPIYHATANSVSQVALSKRFVYNHKGFQKIIDSSVAMTEDPTFGKKIFAIIGIPLLRHIPPFRSANQQYVKRTKEIYDFIQEQIDEHIETLDPDNVQDFIDIYLVENHISKTQKNLDFEANADLRGFIKDLFTAGIETVSITINWAIVTLLHYPEIQAKIQQELDSVVGSDEKIRPGHRKSLPYACAFLEEVMRYHTISPLGAPHLTSADVELSDFYIPKNTMIQAHIWAVHHDPNNWPGPDKFDPLRHIDGDGNFVSSKKVLPFSVGLRRCLGENLARIEMFLFIATILKHFHVLPDSGKSLPPLHMGIHGLFYSPFSFEVVLQERSSLI
uniref:Cytochrome P450 2U1-like n=1 Tax=Phallusia mammillata TaxID=59560 RepID=A0A6F9DB86_9ASCI|nr:cytochrome P450 2U1-like [Phallusia mammillata]